MPEVSISFGVLMHHPVSMPGTVNDHVIVTLFWRASQKTKALGFFPEPSCCCHIQTMGCSVLDQAQPHHRDVPTQ
eukprot:11353286-Karenia_brevis.AAC.1